ncbi:IPT/TIG domain-containing protein [Granulicella sp. L60]|uniref:IPT/TIG domain-containing protein n=1 Tax=Granulicella sp. L60 TaxID=1641866 RepID=UPI00131E62CF|nr:IPT/TIG domain-containing protein [Granulicella sp. L60]
MPAPMTITSMTPNTVYTTGGQVVFAGTNFTPDMNVTFGGVAAQKMYFQSSTLVTAITPVVTAAATVDVAVSSSNGGAITLPKALTYTVPPPPVQPGQCSTLPCTYQAANPANTLLGTATQAVCAGCTNGEKVGSLGFGGWVIINNIYVPADGNYTLTIIGCEGAGTQTYKVLVNGGTAISVPLSGNNWFANAAPVSITVPLKAGGANTIQLGNDTDWSPDVVSITIGGGSSIGLTSLAPNQVLLTGGQVVLTGTNFTSDAAVTFGSVAATSSSFQSSTQITATTPAVKSGGAVDVVVSSAAGGMATLSKGLTYVQCQSVPCTYQAADGGNTLVGNAAVGTCTGCAQGVKVGSLGNGSDVIFNNVYAPSAGNYTLTIIGCEGAGTQNYQVIVNGGTPITIPLTGTNWNAPAAPVSITIDLTAGGNNTIELGNASDYSPDVVSIALSAANPATVPTIASVTPNQLPITGGQVVITGTNFTPSTTVTFGGVAAHPVSSQSATQFTVIAPASATLGAADVVVTSPTEGTATLSKGITYTEPVACTSSTCVYQAWDPQNKLNGGAAVAACVGCPSGLKVGSMGYNNGVTFNNVYAPVAGNYIVTLVGCEGGGTQTYQVSANGGAANNVPLYGNNWYVSTPPVSTVVALNAGSANTITVTNTQTYSPDIVYIAVNPANIGTSSSPQPVTMSSGQNLVTYDLSTGFATFASGGLNKITGFYSEAYVGSTLYRSTSSSYARTASSGANGETDITLTATDGSPTMIQRFIMSANHFTVQVEIDGASAGSSEMSPLVVNQAGAVDAGSYTDPRFLVVPYDNNAYYNYNAETPNGLSDTGYEVGAFYDNTSRNGLVVGSVTHDTWKTGIQFTGNANKLDFLWAYGGANSTEDQLPQSAVSGAKILSPVVMVGYYDDWRQGMEDFANTNAQYAPMLTWTGPAPMGWNSWGKIQNNLSYTNATAVEDYFHTQLPNYNNNGVVYINLDNYWTNLTDSQLQSFVTHAHSQGQKAGIYWTPFIIWNWTDLTTAVDGAPNYKFGDIVMKYSNGTPMGAVDSAWGADPTHPGTQQRIDYYINKFKTIGFDYIKLDFLIHGALEGGSNNGVFYDTTIHTGTQAYSQAMNRLYTDVGTSMLIDESIAPLFPYQYAHTRRVAGDTYGSIEDTKREMASASYGWWMAGRIYNWNDPDEMLLEGTETPSGGTTPVPFTANENKSRVTSGAIAGFMLNGDDVTDAGAPPLVQTWLTNTSINGLPALGLNFRPVEGNTGTAPVNVLVAQQSNVYYVAVFNYDIANPLNTTIDLGRAGLNSSTAYSVTDLWTGKTSSATGSLLVSLGAAESTILKLQ